MNTIIKLTSILILTIFTFSCTKYKYEYEYEIWMGKVKSVELSYSSPDSKYYKIVFDGKIYNISHTEWIANLTNVDNHKRKDPKLFWEFLGSNYNNFISNYTNYPNAWQICAGSWGETNVEKRYIKTSFKYMHQPLSSIVGQTVIYKYARAVKWNNSGSGKWIVNVKEVRLFNTNSMYQLLYFADR